MKRTTRALLVLAMTAGLAGLAGTLLTPASAAAPEELLLGELSRGAPPAVPYLEDHTIVDGSVRIDVPHRVSTLVGRSGDDYLVTAFSPTGPDRLLRVRSDGTRSVVLRQEALYGATLSPDGGTVAHAYSSRRPSTKLRVFDTATGAVLERRTVDGYASVLDYDGTVVAIGSAAPARTLAWNVTSGALTRVSGRIGSAADLANDRLAVVTRNPYLGGCTLVTTFSDPATELWRSCRERVEHFSTNGSRLATVDLLADGLGPGRVWLRRTSGRLLEQYDAPYHFGTVGFEDATDLLMNTYARTKSAIVRCDGATCERASRIRGYNPPLRAARSQLEAARLARRGPGGLEGR